MFPTFSKVILYWFSNILNRGVAAKFQGVLPSVLCFYVLLMGMQIFCGVDIIEISRFDAGHLANQKFLDLCFTKDEQAYCFSMKNPALHFAARFAAKEAVVKALSGFGKSLVYCAIEIKKEANGRPYVVLLSDDEELCRVKIDVSLSHAESHAAASAVVYLP